jgi:hypothetical protein
MGDGDSSGEMPAGSGRDEYLIRLAALLAVALGGVYLTWRTATSWNGTQPFMSVLLYACELFAWALLVSFSYLAWRLPRTDRGLIGRPRKFDVLAGTVGDVVVRIVELKSDGAVILSPRAFEPGRSVDLVGELPLTDCVIHATRLCLTVAACRPEKAFRGWRISGTVVPEQAVDADALREYCGLVSARRPLSLSGRLQDGTAEPPGQDPFHDRDLEIVGAAVSAAAS